MRLENIKNVSIFIQDNQRNHRKNKHITVYDSNTVEVYNIINAALKNFCKKSNNQKLKTNNYIKGEKK